MQQFEVKTSAGFKKMTIKAILTIVLFLLVYLLLVISAIGLTMGCCYLGIMIIVMHPAFVTLALGAGIISVGFLILYFLIKFMFQQHKIDRSHLIEITRDEQPALFDFIQKIVDDVHTDFPKKIYTSSGVNASVFYDSSFWSMFLPIRKNLEIGMGLVNSVTSVELKAILAHEFGHFSQKSMKVGSYTYNVNHVIYNMLYDNDSFNQTAQGLANISGYIAIFIILASKIIQGIQWILIQVYNLLNVTYMGLSREMEFHADEVAANVAGSEPLITSLLRLDIANQAYQTVLEYYNSKIGDSYKATNIYPQQLYVMNFIAKQNHVSIENNLPHVSIEHLSQYNKSKLIINNQWASHPSTIDRVAALNKLNLQNAEKNNEPALSIFNNTDTLLEQTTQKLFSSINYKGKETLIDISRFIEEYTSSALKDSFDKIFNNYYNAKPLIIKQTNENAIVDLTQINASYLFSKETVDLVYSLISLKNDIETLQKISTGEYKIKTFDYDGIKYTIKEINSLIARLTDEQKI